VRREEGTFLWWLSPSDVRPASAADEGASVFNVSQTTIGLLLEGRKTNTMHKQTNIYIYIYIYFYFIAPTCFGLS
jgi:hypothetical protein